MQYINVRDAGLFRESLIGGAYNLGSGMFSDVFDAGKDRVLKIGSLNDEGYIAYMNAAIQMQSRSKFLPVFRSLPTFVNVNTGADSYGHSGFYFVYLERLHSIDTMDEDQCSLYRRLRGAINRAFAPECEQDRAQSEKEYSRNADFAGLIDVLRGAFSTGERWFDMHDGNMMFRGNELVVTDPFSR